MISINPKGSIRHRLFTGMLLTTLSALVTFGAAVTLFDLRNYHENAVQDLLTQSRVVGLSVIPALEFGDAELARRGLAVLESRPNVELAVLYDADGAPFALFQRKDGADAPIPAPRADGYEIQENNLLVFRRITRNKEVLGTILIKGKYQLYQRLWQYMGLVIVLLLLALAVSMLLSLRMQKQVTRPILGITSLARRVAEQRDYSLRASKITNDEVGYLVDAFNDLLSEVESRSAALEASNRQLHREISDRQRANEEVRRLNAQLEQRVADRTAELERANQELEAFSYSVSHDLRAPLRAIDGFSQALLEDYRHQLDDDGKDYLQRVRAAAQRMGQLIDDLLKLARVSRAALNEEKVDLTAMAGKAIADLRFRDPERQVKVTITPGMTAVGDARLLQIVLENLLGNAWKYTSRKNKAEIGFGCQTDDDITVFHVRDNGAGFDMAYADKLFGPFQRLHDAKAFSGTGIGLATVQRIIHRHGGRIWADAKPGEGATFYFTLTTKVETR